MYCILKGIIAYSFVVGGEGRRSDVALQRSYFVEADYSTLQVFCWLTGL